jgi:hypothetical protein
MKKLGILLCTASFLFQCGPEQNKVEIVVEDGVEVVVNHIQPYQIKGESTTFSLDREFSISMENEETSGFGIVDIFGFDIDSEENIFIFGPPQRSENHVFKFNKHGNFIIAFGPKGQGPGEIQYPVYLKIDTKDELPILDMFGSKLVRFNNQGAVTSEIKLAQDLFGRQGIMYPLDNGNYLIVRVEPDLSGEFGNQILSLYSSSLEEIKEIDRFKTYYPQQATKYKIPQDIFWWTISTKGNVYVGNTERGYEISVYDLDGRPIRRIRKEYNPVPVPNEMKEKALGPIPEDHPLRKTLYFADHMPPFECFFLDDQERLFVLTADEEDGQRIFDIYNEKGAFLGRKTLNLSFNRFNRYGTQVFIRNGLFVCIQEKEAGYKELVKYRMIWE